MGVLLSEQKSFKSLQIEQRFDRFDWICQISRQSRLHQAIITIQSYFNLTKELYNISIPTVAGSLICRKPSGTSTSPGSMTIL